MTRKEEFEKSFQKSGGRLIKNFVIRCLDWIITDQKLKPTERYQVLTDIENQIRLKKLLLERL
jgi:hypothetical protein